MGVIRIKEEVNPSAMDGSERTIHMSINFGRSPNFL